LFEINVFPLLQTLRWMLQPGYPPISRNARIEVRTQELAM
jgi:hypothetical protein